MSGRQLSFERAFQIIQEEEYLEAIDLDYAGLSTRAQVFCTVYFPCPITCSDMLLTMREKAR